MAPSTLPAAQVEQLDFSETVNVAVGEGDSKQEFVLHKNIICRHSKFFRAAFLGNFVEAREKIVTLPEADPRVFKIWTQWAYSGNIVLMSATEEETATKTFRSVTSKRRCGELYVLADILGDALCRNTVTDLLRNKYLIEFGPSPELFKIAYERTPENSKLRKLCLDWMLAIARGSWLSETRNELPTAFLVDLAISWSSANLVRSVFTKPARAPKCKYHDHDEDVPACEKGSEDLQKDDHTAEATS